MEVQRTYDIVFEDDADLRATIRAFGAAKRRISATCYNDGTPLGAAKLQDACYVEAKGDQLTAQLACSVIRHVASAYASVKRNKRPAASPFGFHRDHALFLVGKRGRDASFRKDGRISISTVAGRKKLTFCEASGYAGFLAEATLINSINVVEHEGRLIGHVCVTLEVPEPKGIHPVGVDLNETNAVVAVNADDEVCFLSGREDRYAAQKTRKQRARLQRKLASRKAEGRDTRSVRRALTRLGRKQRNRTRTSCQMMAAELSKWAGPDAILVVEDLKLSRKRKGNGMSRALRRRLNGWPYALMLQCITNRAEVSGQRVEKLHPAYTSQTCNRCGVLGTRNRHDFTCSCGYQNHADVNASLNIRDTYTASRRRGVPSETPEALA